jgi:hypothetical protein
MVQPMVRFRQNMGQPVHTEAHPVTEGGEVLVQQGLHAHPFQLGQQQGDVIDAFGRDF